MKKLLLLIVVFLVLSGCASVDKIETVDIAVDKTPLNLPNPEAIKLNAIDWQVITPENQAIVFKKLKDKNIDTVLFGISDTDYEALSNNFLMIRQYIQKYQLLMKQYRKYYEEVGNDGPPS